MKKWSEGKLLLLLLTACLILPQPAVVLSADDDGWARDPFVYEDPGKDKVVPDKVPASVDAVIEAAPEATPKAALEVKGIYKNSADQLIAIINGKEYAAGDSVGDEKIEDIKQFGVVLVGNGITRRIGLFGPNVEWGNHDD